MPAKHRKRLEGRKANNQVSQKLPHCLLKKEKFPKYSGTLFTALTVEAGFLDFLKKMFLYNHVHEKK